MLTSIPGWLAEVLAQEPHPAHACFSVADHGLETVALRLLLSIEAGEKRFQIRTAQIAAQFEAAPVAFYHFDVLERGEQYADAPRVQATELRHGLQRDLLVLLAELSHGLQHLNGIALTWRLAADEKAADALIFQSVKRMQRAGSPSRPARPASW